MRSLKCLFASLLVLFALPCLAAKVVVDVAPGTTQCGFYLDASTTATVVSANTTANTCTYDVQAVAVGSHTVAADTRTNDPIWGSQTSAKSTPWPFTKPTASGNPSTATNFRLVP